MKNFVVISLFFFLFPSIYAVNSSKDLNSFVYKFYDSSNGLPQNSANSFSQNSKGFMYIATQEGFVKYDGFKMDIFDTSNIEKLPSDFIGKIVVNDKDQFLIATDKGLSFYTDTGELIENFTGKNSINQSDITDISLNDDETVLYGAIKGKGVFRVKLGNPEKVSFFTPENKKIGTDKINAIKVFSNGDVYAASRSGMFYLKDGAFIKVEGGDDSFSSITGDLNGNVWAAGNNGLYVISKDKIVKHLGLNDGLPFKHLSSVFADSSGTIWFGSAVSGLGTYKDGRFKAIHSKGSSRFRNILAIFEDMGKNIWVGTAIDGFCIIKDGSIVDSKLKEHLIMGVTKDSSGNIWANSRGRGVVKLVPNGEKKLITDAVGFDLHTILGDSSDRVWISSRNRGIYISTDGAVFKEVNSHFTADDKFPLNPSVLFEDRHKTIWSNDRDRESTVLKFSGKNMKTYRLPVKNAAVTDIVENSDGEIIVGTRQNGLFSFDQVTGKFVRIDIYRSEFFIHNMYFDSKERLWISTHSDGVLIYVDGDTVNLRLENGLFDNTIHAIVEDELHNFWFTTNKGVFSISSKEVECFLSGDCIKVNPVILNESNGMPSRECSGGAKPSLMITEKGMIWIPTIKGMVKIDPLSSFKTETIAPLSFTWLVVDNNQKDRRRIYDTKEVDLPPKTKSVEIHYSSPAFSNPGNILFDHSLDSGQIVRRSKRRFASFSNLRPGSYRFKIKAYINGQKFNRHHYNELVLNIKTPLHLTEKFRFASIAFGFIALLTFFLMNKRVVRKREEEMLRIINEKTFELQLINKELQEAAVKDPLTGLKNRRFLFEFEEENILAFIDSKERSTHLLENRVDSYRKEAVFAILMLDIDHFKRVNDLYGHTSGDLVLVDFSKILTESVRTDDVVIRWGGEEFIVLLKNIRREMSTQVAEKIRKNIESFPFKTENGKTIWITVSIGMAFMPFFDHAPNLVGLDNVISITDLALYNSKNKGRDMCTVVKAGNNIPSSSEQMQGMLASSQYAELNGLYTFEKITSDNFEEFDLEEV